uniref:Uncharacterized protein n=1 Tax=Glossina pallidipes TaxID=7398 RepID=A0A1A9ZWU8_GLOPL
MRRSNDFENEEESYGEDEIYYDIVNIVLNYDVKTPKEAITISESSERKKVMFKEYEWFKVKNKAAANSFNRQFDSNSSIVPDLELIWKEWAPYSWGIIQGFPAQAADPTEIIITGLLGLPMHLPVHVIKIATGLNVHISNADINYYTYVNNKNNMFVKSNKVSLRNPVSYYTTISGRPAKSKPVVSKGLLAAASSLDNTVYGSIKPFILKQPLTVRYVFNI